MRTPAVFPAGLGVWRAAALDTSPRPAWPSGHPALDAVLPGGGWPVGALVEVLQAPAIHLEWHLLLPALRARLAAHDGPLLLIDPPAVPLGPALAAQGLPAQRLVVVRTGGVGAPAALGALAAWACEQALRCPQVAGVLAWWGAESAGPGLRAGAAAVGRRLHLAAQAYKVPLFVFRRGGVDGTGPCASPADVRLHLAPDGADPLSIRVEVLKRRGPPLTAPLQVPVQAAALRGLRPPGVQPVAPPRPRAALGPAGRSQPSRSPMPRVGAGSAMPPARHAVDCPVAA